jgi:hypothetical protein
VDDEQPVHDAGTAAVSCGVACDAGAPEQDAATDGATKPDAGDPHAGCPWLVSVTTRSYGTGDESQDDYAPRNVGAIWVTTHERGFVRTVALWGPGYYEFAETWVAQSHGSKVDITTMATRSNHERPVEATWDCKDSQGQVVSPGAYQLNVEFAEAEMQGPLLSGDKAITFQIGPGAAAVVRAARGSFGEIRITPSTP